MLFELSCGSKSTHAGVLEFIAEEGRVYLPHWVRISACLLLPFREIRTIFLTLTLRHFLPPPPHLNGH